MTKADRKEYMRQWRQQNRQFIKKYSRRYYLSHVDERRAYQHRYYLANRDRIRAYYQEYSKNIIKEQERNDGPIVCV